MECFAVNLRENRQLLGARRDEGQSALGFSEAIALRGRCQKRRPTYVFSV